MVGGALGGWVKKWKVLRSTNYHLKNYHRDVKYSIGNTVNNTAISMFGTRCVVEIPEGTLYEVYDCLTVMLYTGD